MKRELNILKIGGKVLSQAAQLTQVLEAFVQLPTAKILVHGGGKTGTEIAHRLGIEVQMREGRRITDAPMLEVAMMVYGGLKNKGLVAQLQALGQNALGLTGADLNLIEAVKRPVREIDFGYVGDIVSVQAEQLAQLLSNGILPVLAPLTHDGNGQMLNTNADTIASAISGALADKYKVNLIYSFEKSGVLRDPDDETSLIREINQKSYERYKAEGAISGGMIPKLDNAFSALESGVACVYICKSTAIADLNRPGFVGTRIFLT